MNPRDERQIYKNAPIIEAVIDIRFSPEETLDFETLKLRLSDKVSEHGYPNVQVQVHNEFNIKFGDEPSSEKISTHRQLRFTSQNRKQILQVGKESFIFSRLAPYDCWENYIAEVKKLFEIYKKETSPVRATRTGVRFINRFDFPESNLKISDYLNIFPHVPDSFLLSGLAMQIILKQENPEIISIIREALAPPTRPGYFSLLLDLDLFNDKQELHADKIWDFFEILHLKKNDIFENAITEKTRGMIS